MLSDAAAVVEAAADSAVDAAALDDSEAAADEAGADEAAGVELPHPVIATVIAATSPNAITCLPLIIHPPLIWYLN
jgi:hypothetical protein